MTPTANTPVPPPLYSKKQTAGHLLVSVRTLEMLVAQKAIEVIRIGKCVRFSPEAVAKFKASRTVKAIA